MLVSWMNFQRKCDKKRLVMYVNAPSENHFERNGVYVSIRNLYFGAPKRDQLTFSAVDYDGNNSTSFFPRCRRLTARVNSLPVGVEI